MFVFERTSISNCAISTSIPTVDKLFPPVTIAIPPLFGSSKLIHLLDKEVGEEGIVQHLQAHPDTALSTAFLRESLSVCVCAHVCMCARAYVCVSKENSFYLHRGAHWREGSLL